MYEDEAVPPGYGVTLNVTGYLDVGGSATMKLYECRVCGAAVTTPNKHTAWHKGAA